MTTRINNQGVAVDDSYFWKSMTTCPTNTKVQLLNPGGVAIYGTYNGTDSHWLGWAPLPKRKKETT